VELVLVHMFQDLKILMVHSHSLLLSHHRISMLELSVNLTLTPELLSVLTMFVKSGQPMVVPLMLSELVKFLEVKLPLLGELLPLQLTLLSTFLMLVHGLLLLLTKLVN